MGVSEALLAALADSLTKALELGADVEARVSAGTQLWMLRWASHVAAAWSSGSHHADWLSCASHRGGGDANLWTSS